MKVSKNTKYASDRSWKRTQALQPIIIELLITYEVIVLSCYWVWEKWDKKLKFIEHTEKKSKNRQVESNLSLISFLQHLKSFCSVLSELSVTKTTTSASVKIFACVIYLINNMLDWMSSFDLFKLFGINLSLWLRCFCSCSIGI